jgi:hypothetical protein
MRQIALKSGARRGSPPPTVRAMRQIALKSGARRGSPATVRTMRQIALKSGARRGSTATVRGNAPDRTQTWGTARQPPSHCKGQCARSHPRSGARRVQPCHCKGQCARSHSRVGHGAAAHPTAKQWGTVKKKKNRPAGHGVGRAWGWWWIR